MTFPIIAAVVIAIVVWAIAITTVFAGRDRARPPQRTSIDQSHVRVLTFHNDPSETSTLTERGTPQ